MSTVLPDSSTDDRTPLIIPAPVYLTVAEFDRYPDQKSFELASGRLVERAMGVESDLIGMRLAKLIAEFVETHALGFVFGAQCGYRLRSDGGGETIRKPDVSFVRFGRFLDDKPPKGWAELAPDLAAEVISPNDLAEELHIKLRQYKENGVRLVWVLWPDTQSIDVYRLDGSTVALSRSEHLDGEDVLPGFRQSVASIFERPRPAIRAE